MTSARGNAGVDLGAVWDSHVRAEFETKDADSAVTMMTDDAELIHVAVATGARGREALRRFYADHFIPGWPDDVEVQSISRTVGGDQVVDELLIRCTHSRRMEFWLPGIAPSGRSIELPTVAIVGFENGNIKYERIYWDQGSLLAQVGALDPAAVPLLGHEQAQAIIDDHSPLNDLIRRWS